MCAAHKDSSFVGGHTCPRCSKPVEKGDRFCRNCGAELRTDEQAIQAIIGRVLPERIDAALKERFREQKVVEIETAELLADRAVKWLKTLGFILGIPTLLIVAALSFVGIKTWSDLQNVAERAASLEKQLTGPQQQLANASQEISQLSKELETAKQSLAGQISQVGQRQANLEAQLQSIRNRLEFCREGESSAELKKKLEDELTNFVAWLEGIGFDKRTDRISVCIFSDATKLANVENVPGLLSIYRNGTVYIHTSVMADSWYPLWTYSQHALTKGIGINLEPSTDEAYLVVEALADYYTASFLDTPILGGKWRIGTLDNDLKFKGDERLVATEAWGGALWACRKINRKQIDEQALVAWRTANAHAAAKGDISKSFGAALSAAPAPAGACLSAQIEKRNLPH
jgi:hypothetical protein